MVPPRGNWSVKKIRTPQMIVPASMAADSTKLYLDHHSKFLRRTRYSGNLAAAASTHTEAQLNGTRSAWLRKEPDSRKMKPTMSDDEKLMPDAGGTNSRPVRAIGKWK